MYVFVQVSVPSVWPEDNLAFLRRLSTLLFLYIVCSCCTYVKGTHRKSEDNFLESFFTGLELTSGADQVS